jgi:hypothetical protein
MECTGRNVAAVNYTLRYNVLSTCDCSGVHETISAGIVVASLSATDRYAVNLAAPRGSVRIIPWFRIFFKVFDCEEKLHSPIFKKETL